MSETTREKTDESGVSTPTFRGCVFCYSAEWAAYAARRVRGRTSES